MSGSEHPVVAAIRQADRAISEQDFDTLMGFYADDAVLVVEPGRVARGKTAIREAFVAIVRHFSHGLRVTQGDIEVLEGADTTLVIMQTLLHVPGEEQPIERRATYVFRRNGNDWLCAIDNSYGTALLDGGSAAD